MKVKTSITLSKEILRQIDQHAEGANNRSAFIELAVRTYLEMAKRTRRDQRDMEIINRASEKLNREAMDVLQYQAEQEF
jgi:metal-responsive CopG/Arc/MetJ family transcriptional regulator